MGALRTLWAMCSRSLHAGTWLSGATAAAQWALAGCSLAATTTLTAGYIWRLDSGGRSLKDLGPIAAWAFVAGAAVFLVALVIGAATWGLIWASLRRAGTDLERGPRRRREVWWRIWSLLALTIGPPLVGALVSGQKGLAVAPIFTLYQLPLGALALWLVGAYFLLSYWMRRVCFRVGVVGLVVYLIDRRFWILPRWMVEWPTSGGALGLTPAESGYLEFLTGMVMSLGVVALGSMMLAGRPLMAPGPVIVTPPPLPPLPGPTPPAPTPQSQPPREVELPRHPSGRVIRRMDV